MRNKQFFQAFPLTAPTIVTSGSELVGLVQALTNWFFVGFLLTAVVFVIIAAFQFLTGGGDPVQVAGARKKLIWAVVAVIIAVLARAIPLVVENIITGTGGDVTPPTLATTSMGGDTESLYQTTDTTPDAVVSSNENAFCRIGTSDSPYSFMVTQCTGGENATSHTCNLGVSFTVGNHTVFVACQDGAGNGNDTLSNRDIPFEVTP